MVQRSSMAILALLVCLTLVGCGSKVTMTNYERIEDGMSLAEVEGILGKGTEQSSSNVPGVSAGGISIPGASSKAMVWKNGNNVISVMFLNDKVMSKTQMGL